MNLAGVLERRAVDGGWADDVAFLCGDRSYTHAEVHAGAARVAALLARLGAGRGDRVLIALPDGIEFVWAFLGAIRLGAVAVPVNPRLTPADHAELPADVVVCRGVLVDRFEGVPVVAGEDLAATAAACPPIPAAEVHAADPAYAQYTSGTTGVPKAAVHAHAHPPAYFDAFAGPAIALGRDDVVLSVSKLYFAYGLGNALFFPLLAGCRAVLHAAHPVAEDVAGLVARHRVTVLFSVPTFYARLVAAGDGRAWSSLRVAVSAGEALGAALAARAEALLGCPVLDGVGSTEVGQTFASNTLACARPGTVGRALPPYRVRVVGAPTGEAGALEVSGPTLPLGHPGEWLATGDLASLDAEGFLRLHGRADDVEQVGGISVSPQEVEAVLARHPGVSEVAVAGILGGDGASRLEAFVVAAPDAGWSDVLEAELVALARAELAPFKVPRSVTFVDALPRTPTGKLRRFLLRTGQAASSAANPSR